MDNKTRIIKATLADGTELNVEAVSIGGDQDIAAVGMPSFEGVTHAIEQVSQSVIDALKNVRPRKATIAFGMEVAIESGKLTAFLVKGSGTASLNITLEWGED